MKYWLLFLISAAVAASKIEKKNCGCSLELPLLSPVHKISLSNSKFLNKTHINGTLVWHSEYFHIYKIERCVYENVIFAPLLRLRQFSRIPTIHALNKKKKKKKKKRKRKWRQWAGIYTITLYLPSKTPKGNNTNTTFFSLYKVEFNKGIRCTGMVSCWIVQNEIVSSYWTFQSVQFRLICFPASQAFNNLWDYGAYLGYLDHYLHLSNKHVLLSN